MLKNYMRGICNLIAFANWLSLSTINYGAWMCGMIERSNYLRLDANEAAFWACTFDLPG